MGDPRTAGGKNAHTPRFQHLAEAEVLVVAQPRPQGTGRLTLIGALLWSVAVSPQRRRKGIATEAHGRGCPHEDEFRMNSSPLGNKAGMTETERAQSNKGEHSLHAE